MDVEQNVPVSLDADKMFCFQKKDTVESILGPAYSLYKSAVTTCFAGKVSCFNTFIATTLILILCLCFYVKEISNSSS